MLELMERAINVLYQLIVTGHALQMATSFGKDSMCTSILSLEAIRRAKAAGIKQAVHFVTTASTTIENPAMERHVLACLDELQQFCEEHDLPVEAHIATPTMAAQFVVSTIGRGTLIRTNENSVANGKRTRPCSDDWKVQPQGKLAKLLGERVQSAGYREPVVVLGSRSAESTSRAASMVKQNSSETEATRSQAGQLTVSPIASWSTDDVWECLSHFNNATKSPPFESFASTRMIDRVMEIYRDANEGMCGVVLGEAGNRAACGARMGCAFCAIAGDKDKSLSSMIQEPRHAHLKGINDFRNYLIRTQWDMGKRELVGRKLSAVGALRIKPDVYSFQHRMHLLGMLLTLDVLEQERAENYAEDIAAGVIPDTPENRELADIQFQFVTPQQIVAIDFQLSMHHYAPHAFPAVSKWYEVYTLGRRYAIPDVQALQKVDVKSYGWYEVGAFNKDVPTDGLRSYIDEQWNPYRHPDRPVTWAGTSQGERIVFFSESGELTVDAEEACAFVTCSFGWEMFQNCQAHVAIESARFWLNEEILRLATGTAYKYQEMAKRGQYFAHLRDKLNLAPAALDAYLIKHAMSDATHEALLIKAEAENQLDLFQAAA